MNSGNSIYASPEDTKGNLRMGFPVFIVFALPALQAS